MINRKSRIYTAFFTGLKIKKLLNFLEFHFLSINHYLCLFN